jgi:hypothetical protein
MSKHPTSKNKNKRSKLKVKFAKVREEAQLHGIIETTPDGAVRDERVPLSLQGEQEMPGIDRDAIRRGWAVPEEKKPLLVNRLMEPFFEETQTVMSRDGELVTMPVDRHLLKENFKALALADRMQYERDHPEEAGKARGNNKTEVNVGVAVMVDPFALYKRALEEVRVDEVEERIREIEGSKSKGTVENGKTG